MLVARFREFLAEEGIRLAGLLAKGLKFPLPLLPVGVDFGLMSKVKGNGPEHLFQGESGK
jgi:hypothetical protein